MLKIRDIAIEENKIDLININKPLFYDMMDVAGGMFRMNASTADGYGFNESSIDPGEISFGIFAYNNELLEDLNITYYFDFETKQVYFIGE